MPPSACLAWGCWRSAGACCSTITCRPASRWGWLGLVLLLLLGAGGICAGASPGWRSFRCWCSSASSLSGDHHSIVWALGVLLYMDKLPDTYRAAMMMLSSLILTGSAIMLFGSRRTLYGAVLPLGFAMLFELSGGNTQERIVSCMLAGYLFVFLPTRWSLRRDQVASLPQFFQCGPG